MSQITVDYIDHMGSDLSVVNAARVSFDKESEWVIVDWKPEADRSWSPVTELSAKDEKLIHYLAEHEHYSPFGHCFASFRVTAPVFVSRQLVKHKFLRINEISRRYVDSEPEFYTPDVWREKAVDKKQGSGGPHPLFNHGVGTGYREEEYEYNQECLNFYNRLIDMDVAPEMARMVLPQSMMTSWWWSGSLDAFAAMCKLRLKPDAQYETRIVAEKISEKMKELFPVSWEALVSKHLKTSEDYSIEYAGKFLAKFAKKSVEGYWIVPNLKGEHVPVQWLPKLLGGAIVRELESGNGN